MEPYIEQKIEQTKERKSERTKERTSEPASKKRTIHASEDILYEAFHKTSPLGISFAWFTNSGGHHPLHWHNELEILYPLSGKADIQLSQSTHSLLKRHLLVVESGCLHSTHSETGSAMFLCIHISKDVLRDYLPELDTLHITCSPDIVTDDNFKQYLELCQMLDNLTKLYIREAPAFYLEADGIVLQIMGRLAEYFSSPSAPDLSPADTLSSERIHQIITFVEEHFHEPITLDDAAGLLGLGREYFCRFIKKNMGMTFLQYLNEIRASHVYYDLIYTDLPVMEIMEKNGFTNQKLFNRTFRSLYGCTPTEARKQGLSY